MELQTTICTLSAACGVTGDERAATAVAERLLRPLVDRTEIDCMGNLRGFRASGTPGAKTVLLDAHLDEVGLIISGHDRGFLKFTTQVGGVDERMLPGRQVEILTNPPLRGVMIGLPPELQAEEDRKKPVSAADLRIDAGLSAAEAEEILIGTRVAYAAAPLALENGRICGKSLDDRACFAALLYAMTLLRDEALPVNVIVQGSVQEEEGEAGALTGTAAAAPDLAIVTDVTFGDVPYTPGSGTFPLESGAIIGISPMLDSRVTAGLQAAARRQGIPVQLEVMEGYTGTNSMSTQIAGAGVPSGLVSLPLRYMHTPVEVVSTADVAAVGRLLAAFLRTPGEEATV